MFETVILEPLRLPKDAPLERVRLAPTEGRGPDYDTMFDFRTLAYGAVRARGGVVLVCPKLGRLAQVLRDARIAGAGGALRWRGMRRFRRYDEVWISGGEPGPVLEVVLPEAAGGAVRRITVMTRRPVFDGLRCLTTKSKDNDLAWIADWARHHVRAQGAEGVVLFDNGSTAYAPEEVTEVLAASGLKAATVVSADLPFGPTAVKPPHHIALFFQSATLNLARHWALPRAAAVAVNDIDELFLSRGGRTIFEAAEQSRLGYVTAQGHWRSRAQQEGPPRHVQHVMRDVPEALCKEKFCIVPGGPLRWFGWDVHGVGRYQFNGIARARDQYFAHCREISTGWKYQRGSSDGAVERCPETAAGLEASLGGGA
ncbi:hypothetical protein [Oceanicola sp. 502str15]|uniref:hypothetical protein n=1 Tax=Oceanicola sp. 502str15 TaxID=2696061 RepID=UPI002094D1B8|nr:hypothetical protein [Oceanicola sp. 502str15]MCO6381696.1 hypothetical protein [Oceanicola sp. 502str15]